MRVFLLVGLQVFMHFFCIANVDCGDVKIYLPSSECRSSGEVPYVIYQVDDPARQGRLQVLSSTGDVLAAIDVPFDGQDMEYNYVDLPLSAGDVSVQVLYTSAEGCEVSGETTLRMVSDLELQSVGPTCAGAGDGTIEVQRVDGASILWTDGASTWSRADLAAGNYGLTVMQANGCSSSDVVVLTDPSPLSAVHKATMIECNGVQDNRYRAYVEGGVAPFSYSWTVDGVEMDIDDADIHQVTSTDVSLVVSDANGCVVISTLKPGGITPSPMLARDVAIPPMQVNKDSDDMYDLSVALDLVHGDADNDNSDGSVFDVTYHYTMVEAIASNNELPQMVMSSPGSTYYLRSQASSDCFDVAAVSLLNMEFCLEVSESCDNDEPIELVPVECTQTLTPLPAGGTFEIFRRDASGTLFPAPDALVMIGGVAHIDPMDREGNFEVNYTYNDGSGLVTSTAFFDIQALNPRLNIEVDTICGNQPTLQIRTNPIGGTLDGLAIIDDFVRGTNQFFIVDPTSLAVEQNHAFTYTYTQENASGLICTSIVSDSFYVRDYPRVDIAISSAIQCQGTSVMQVATVSNPTPGLTLQWTNAADQVVGNTAELNVPSLAGDDVFTITATSAEGCFATDNVDVTANPLPVLTCLAESEVSCPAGADGVAIVDILGVSDYLGYSFVWSTGATTREVGGLSAGTYGITVTTDLGCVDSCSVVVTEPPTFDIDCVTGIQPPLCAGDATAVTEVDVLRGGVPPYMYSADNISFSTDNTIINLAAGINKVYVMDATGCIDSCIFMVPTTPGLVCSIAANSVSAASCFSVADGSATVTASGGTGTTTYRWDNGETGATATQLAAGSRSVVVTDANGCTTQCTITIDQPDVLTCAVDQSSDARCNGEASGSATVTVAGGNGGNTYVWSNGATSQTASLLAAANYTVTVTDSEGCMTSCSVVIDEPLPLTAAPIAATVCEGDMMFVDADPDTRIVSHAWSIVGGSSTGVVLEDEDEAIVKVNAMQAVSGTVRLQYIGQDVDGCQVMREVAFTVEDAPEVGEDVMITVCNADRAEYQVDLPSLLSSSAMSGGEWRYLGGVNGPDISDPTLVNFECFASGTYVLGYTLQSQGVCPDRTATVTIEVVDCFDLAIKKTVTQGVLLSLDEPVGFTIEVINQGPVAAHDVAITDYVEPEFNFDPSINTAALTGNGFSWTASSVGAELYIGLIPPYTSVTVFISLDIDPSFTGEELYNSTEITSYGIRVPSGSIKQFPPDQDDFDIPPPNRDDENDDDVSDDYNGGEDNPEDDDQFDFAIVRRCGSTASQVNCNDVVNISLDDNCEALITPEMILQGEHISIYQVVMKDTFGNRLPNPLTEDHLGLYIDATILDECSANSCWARLILEDKLPPVITCLDDVTISCMISDVPLSIPDAVDACEGSIPVTISSDQYNDRHCDMGLRGIRTIEYYAEDSKGNRSRTCSYTISYDSISMDDIVVQESIVLECDEAGVWDQNDNYYPDPWEVQMPSVGGIPLATFIDQQIDEITYNNRCQVNVTFDDVVQDICENSYNLVRKWSILDWCSGQLEQYTQVILVTDTESPLVVAPDDNFMIMADPLECTGDYVVEAPIIVSEECGTTTYTVSYLLADNTGGAPVNGLYIDDNVVTLPDGRYVIRDLPIGQTWIRYTVTDACGNTTFAFTEILIIDEVPPIPVCDQFTTVTLTSSGLAKISAFTFDDGSHDNCTEDVFFEARRMTAGCGSSTAFGPDVSFCCADAAVDEVMVELRVWDDANGNGIFGDEITVIFDSNGSGVLGDIIGGRPDFSFRYADQSSTCMVSVKVDDKIDPVVFCPDDITIACGADYLDFDITGEPVHDDNCGSSTITHDDIIAIDQCGVGSVVRTFTVVDLGGRSVSCTQVITVRDDDPYDFDDPNDLSYPADITMQGCYTRNTDVDQTGEPQINDDACSLVAYTYTDQLLSIADSACYKLFRTFTVIDWCQFDQFNPLLGVDRHTQTIFIENLTAPDITDCTDKQACILGDNCSGQVTLTIDASDDCTPTELLQYTLAVDLDDNGSRDLSSSASEATYVLPVGEHRVTWTVADKCGNVTTCSHLLTVEDCKKPTPYCLSEVTTVIMPTSGSISIAAADFDLGSTDNCDGPLTFAFDSLGNSPTRQFVCNDLGINQIQVWAIDQAGNADFCETWVHIQSNGGCNGSRPASISGRIYNELNADLTQIDVTLQDNQSGETRVVKTDSLGAFAFEELYTSDYQLGASVDGPYDEGVSTLDIVLIQRHILGIVPLDSPYKLLAADVNDSESVTGADVVTLRKLILGIVDKFEETESWKFVPTAESYDPTSPWPARELVRLDITDSTSHVVDFMGLKMGDVNTSAVNGLLGDDLDSRSRPVTLQVDEPQLQSSGLYKMAVRPADDLEVLGYQFTLQYDASNLVFRGIEAGAHPLADRHYHLVEPGTIAVSLDLVDDLYVSRGEVLFDLMFDSVSGVVSNESLQISNAGLRAEIYDATLTTQRLELESVDQQPAVFRLYQNSPNPFKGQTVVRFDMLRSADATLVVYDMIGNTVASFSGYYEEGSHSMTIDDGQLAGSAGILYYRLSTQGYTDTKKMMVLY